MLLRKAETAERSCPLSAIPTLHSVNLQSHAFLQTYGAILPTSLTYIVLSARGCSPWRPAAVMGTTRSGMDTRTLKRLPSVGSASFGFQGPFVLALVHKGLRVRPRSSSGFRTLSRTESNSRVLWSIVGSGGFPRPRPSSHRPAAIPCGTAHRTAARRAKTEVRCPRPEPLRPFGGGE